jgi:RND family efflux transporter MFP subunit
MAERTRPAGLAALCIAAASMLALAGCNQNGAEAADAPAAETAPSEAPVVEVVRVSSTHGAQDVRATGVTAYQRESTLAFAVSGELEAVNFDMGDEVRAGQTMAVLRRTSVGADAGEAAIVRKTAEDNFARIQRLYDNGAASRAELDNARLALERTRDRVVLTAPVGGVVLARQAELGQVVGPGQAVFLLGEAKSGVVVSASVTSEEAVKAKIGSLAQVDIRGGRALKGKVSRMSPRAGAVAGVFEIEIALENAAGLRGGEVAEVRILPAEETGAASATGSGEFLIPALALTDARADQGAVFVVDAAGVARRRAVETGGLGRDGVIILNGLAEGDAVITRGANMVRDGDPVRIAGQ